jgi:signal peptidase II
MSDRKKYALCTLAIAVLVILDQVTKKLAEYHLTGKGEIKVFGDYIILLYIRNRGAFLSFGHELGQVVWMTAFIIIPVIVLCALSAYIIIKKMTGTFYLTVWVLVLSGGLGNLIDRVLYGNVIDFMNIGIGSVRTGIFNVADLYMVAFTAILVIWYLKGCINSNINV